MTRYSISEGQDFPMRLLLCTIFALLLSACGSGHPGDASKLPETVQQLCTFDPIVKQTWVACGITIYETDQGVLIAGIDFNMPTFSGLQGAPQGQCALLTNGVALRSTLGQPDYCNVVVSLGRLTGVEDSTGWIGNIPGRENP